MSIFPAEYSTLSSNALLEHVTTTYNIPNTSTITFIKRGFNDTYLIQHTSTKLILRVYKHRWRSYNSIISEINLLNYLKENHVSVASPLPDTQGNYIHTLQAIEGTRYAVLFSYAQGEQVRKLSEEQAFLLGTETGKIHRLTHTISYSEPAQDYSIKTQFGTTLHILKPILTAYPEQYNRLIELKSTFTQLFNKPEIQKLPKGLCHGDLQAENFHITENKILTFFDFDFFGSGYLAYDIGVFRWYDHKNKTPQIMDAFLKGYETERKLNPLEIALIPYFGTMRALFQMTLYCNISNGKQLPLWPAEQIAAFINKTSQWHQQYAKMLPL